MENTNETNIEANIEAVEIKLTKKERKEKWKAAKRERRKAQKEFYKYAPGIVRNWNLYIKETFLRASGDLHSCRSLL